MLTFTAMAQTTEPQDPQDADNLTTTIAAARCQYTPADAACRPATGSTQTVGDENSEVAQAGRMPRRPPGRRPMAYPARYPRYGEISGRRVAIGAAIGLGLGAAIGAKVGSNQPSGTAIKASFFFGGFGALIGAGIGSMPPFQARNRQHRDPWRHRNQDEEDEVASKRANPKNRTYTTPTNPLAAKRCPQETCLELVR